MGRPPAGLGEFLEWQQRLENYRESGLSLERFCLQEGVSRSTFYRWSGLLRDGLPQRLKEEQADRELAESGEAVFLPITLKASPIEVQFPNGTVLQLPLDVGQAALVEIVRAAGRGGW